VIAVTSLAAHAQSDPPKVPLFDNLGRHHYAITTATPLAQRYFDQGTAPADDLPHARPPIIDMHLHPDLPPALEPYFARSSTSQY
jgi:hypothetical protein